MQAAVPLRVSEIHGRNLTMYFALASQVSRRMLGWTPDYLAPSFPVRHGGDHAHAAVTGTTHTHADNAPGTPVPGHAAALLAAGAVPARVIACHGSRVDVHDGRQVRPLARPVEDLVVGDWLLVRRDADTAELLWRCPRRTLLRRRTPHGHAQALVSNIDALWLVMALDADFSLDRLERYLLVARDAGCPLHVLLSKADQAAPAVVSAAHRDIAARFGTRLAITALDTRDPLALQSLLATWPVPASIALLGSSGVGKSTLTNTLLGVVHQQGIQQGIQSSTQRSTQRSIQGTMAVNARDQRGRHTTTHRQLFRLASGHCLIDTPGLRGLRPDVDASDLDALLRHNEGEAWSCRFRNCRHEKEPGCALRATLSEAQLANRRKLLRELDSDAERRARKARDRGISRQVRAFYRWREEDENSR